VCRGCHIEERIEIRLRAGYRIRPPTSPSSWLRRLIAHALDLIGERWALLVVRELRLGARRYVDLQASLPGIGPSVLSQRLRDLERVGVIRRRRLAPPASYYVYELTDWGAELEQVFRQLARWGMRSPVVALSGEAVLTRCCPA